MPQRYLRHGSGLDLRILQAADSTSTALNARVPPLGTCTFHGLERIQSLGRRRPRGECGGHDLSVLGELGAAGRSLMIGCNRDQLLLFPSGQEQIHINRVRWNVAHPDGDVIGRGPLLGGILSLSTV